MAQLQVFRGSNHQFYFRLKSSNGKTILSSEGYVAKQGCLNGIESVRLHSRSDSNYERKTSNSGYTFNLKASNGQIIGRSEVYESSAGRDNGIEAVKRDTPSAPVIDLT